MTQRTVVLTDCDICGQEGGRRYTVEVSSGLKREVDLCSDHAVPIERILAEGRTVDATASSGRSQRGPALRKAPTPTPIYTQDELDEIEVVDARSAPPPSRS